jgi:hypothetical protein
VVSGGGEQDRPIRVRDTPLFSAVNSSAFFTAAVSAAVGGSSWVLTFTTWTSFMSSSYFTPFFVLAFPLVGWSVFVVYLRGPGWRGGGRPNRQERQERTRAQQAALLAAIPAPLRIPLGLLLAAVVVMSLLSRSSLPGAPEYNPGTGHYFYDEHGALTLISRAAYLHAITAQDRLFLGISLVFTSIALAVTWQERRLRRDLADPDGWMRPLRPRPRLIPPAALLAVVVAGAIVGAVASVSLIITRVDSYNTDGIYLHSGHPVTARLAPDHYTLFVGCTESMTCPEVPPAALSVRVTAGGVIGTSADPSHDDLSEAQPFVGRLSFTVSTAETVTLDLTASLGQPAFVVPSEGEEVRALAGWIALAILSVVVFVAALALLIVLAAWRLGFGAPDGYRTQAGPFKVA